MRKLTTLLLCLLCSCASVRRSTSFSQVVKDSVSHEVTDSLTQLQTRYHFASSKDTVIYVAGRIASLGIAAADLQPLYTASGKPVAREFRKDTARMHIVARFGPDGSLTITATADSLTMVIKGLIREKDSIALASSRNRTETGQKTQSEQTAMISSTTKQRGLLSFIMPAALAGVIGIVLVWVSFKGKIIINLFKKML